MKKILYGSWLALYGLCAGLAHIAEPTARQSTAHTLLSILFFVPAAILLIRALRQTDAKTLKTLRIISLCSLGLTLLLLIANVSSMLAGEVLGNILYELLIFASVPMICSRHWVISLFLWACLLILTLPKKKNP